MPDSELMEMILRQLEDVDTINLTYGCEVKGDYDCGDEIVTIHMTDPTGAIGALASVINRFAEYCIGDEKFSRGDVSLDVLSMITRATEIIHNAIVALMIRDPSAKILHDEPEDEER